MRLTLLGLALALALALAGCRRGRSAAAAPVELGSLRERGESLFFGRAGCVTCHKLGARGDKSRGPNLGRGDGMDSPIGVRAALRRPALRPVEYLVESMIDPDAVIAPSFARGVMTPPDRAPINLHDDEVVAVAVFLASDGGPAIDAAALAGARARIALTRKARATRIADARAAELLARVPWRAGDSARGAAVMQRLGCANCHDDPSRARLGAPSLIDVARRLPREDIVRWVIAPPTKNMPTYQGAVSGQELADLAARLTN